MNSIISLGHNLLVSLYLADCSLAKKETRNNCLSTACDLEVGSWCRWTVVDFILYKKWNQGSISFIGNIVIDPSVSCGFDAAINETDSQRFVIVGHQSILIIDWWMIPRQWRKRIRGKNVCLGRRISKTLGVCPQTCLSLQLALRRLGGRNMKINDPLKNVFTAQIKTCFKVSE